MPLASALHSAEVPTVVAGVWVETTDGPAHADAVQPIRDSDLAAHRVDGRRPRPAPGPDHRGARDGGPLPALSDRRALRLRRQHQAAPGPGQRVSPRGWRHVARPRWSPSWSDWSPSPRPRPPARPRPHGAGCSSSRCPRPSGRLRPRHDAEPRPTVRAFGRRRHGHERRRSSDVAHERLRHPGRRHAGGGERLDRRPGLRGRRAVRARRRRRRVHHRRPASRPTTGWCTCRSPTPSTATTASCTAPRSACSVTS